MSFEVNEEDEYMSGYTNEAEITQTLSERNYLIIILMIRYQ